MKETRRNRGFILLLVVALIPLVGMVIAILSVNSKSLAFQTRKATLQTHAQNACESGLAWGCLNHSEIETLTPGQPIVLSLDHHRKNITCSLELITQNDVERVVEVIGRAEDSRLNAQESRRMTFFRPDH